MRILVIEDEQKLNLGIKKGLKFEGYSVDSAFNGEEGQMLAEDPLQKVRYIGNA